MVESKRERNGVFVRVRPLIKDEKSAWKIRKNIISQDHSKVKVKKGAAVADEFGDWGTYEYEFEDVFHGNHSIKDIASGTRLRKLADRVVAGENTAFISYGYKNSGKTTALSGQDGLFEQGLVVQLISELFAAASIAGKDVTIKVSVFRVASDSVIDTMDQALGGDSGNSVDFLSGGDRKGSIREEAINSVEMTQKILRVAALTAKKLEKNNPVLAAAMQDESWADFIRFKVSSEGKDAYLNVVTATAKRFENTRTVIRRASSGNHRILRVRSQEKLGAAAESGPGKRPDHYLDPLDYPDEDALTRVARVTMGQSYEANIVVLLFITDAAQNAEETKSILQTGSRIREALIEEHKTDELTNDAFLQQYIREINNLKAIEKQMTQWLQNVPEVRVYSMVYSHIIKRRVAKPQNSMLVSERNIQEQQMALRRRRESNYEEESALTVLVRVRPLNTRELLNKKHPVWKWEEKSIQLLMEDKGGNHSSSLSSVRSTRSSAEDVLKLRKRSKGGSSSGGLKRTASVYSNSSAGGAKIFKLERVYGPLSETEEIYSQHVKAKVETAMQGVNATIFAYGQTSSGKTFTMLGSPEHPGIIPNALQDVFEIAMNNRSREYLVSVSYFEIYNEQVSDLLAPKGAENKCEVQQSEDGVVLAGLRNEAVSNAEQVLFLLCEGNRRRHVASTDMNSASSRSHTVFQLTIESVLRSEDEALATLRTLSAGAFALRGHGSRAGNVTAAKLNLVDLAGSERASQTNATGERLKEGGFINKSLMALGAVIKAIGAGKEHAAPFRDSNLTRVLQPSLGGNARTVVICTMSPAEENLTESQSTLFFAMRARKVVNKATANVQKGDDEIFKKYEIEMRQVARRVKTLRKYIMSAEVMSMFLDLHRRARMRISEREANDEAKRIAEKEAQRKQAEEQKRAAADAARIKRKEERRAARKAMDLSTQPFIGRFFNTDAEEDFVPGNTQGHSLGKHIDGVAEEAVRRIFEKENEGSNAQENAVPAQDIRHCSSATCDKKTITAHAPGGKHVFSNCHSYAIVRGGSEEDATKLSAFALWIDRPKTAKEGDETLVHARTLMPAEITVEGEKGPYKVFFRDVRILHFDVRSFLVAEYTQLHTFATASATLAEAGSRMSERLLLEYAAQLCTSLSMAAESKFIHGCISERQVLIRPTKQDGAFVILLDQGNSIDMSMYAPGTRFHGEGIDPEVRCPAMRAGKPWTFQIDSFGLVSALYRALFCEPIRLSDAPLRLSEVSSKKARWRLERQSELKDWDSPYATMWLKFIDEVLNIPDCGSQVNLSDYAKEFHDAALRGPENDDEMTKAKAEKYLESLHKEQSSLLY